MATLATLKSRIALDLKRNDLTTRIGYAISDAIDEYKGRRFAFNQARDTFSTVAGTEFYGSSVNLTSAGRSIPDEIAQVDAITMTVNGRRVVLDQMPFGVGEWINSTTTSQGQPTRWSWYAEQIRLYPIPDAAYTLTVSYLQRIEIPASDGDSNAWTTEAEQLIRACAEKTLYRDVLRNLQAAASAEAAESVAFRRLKREFQQITSGGLVSSPV